MQCKDYKAKTRGHYANIVKIVLYGKCEKGLKSRCLPTYTKRRVSKLKKKHIAYFISDRWHHPENCTIKILTGT